jgi:hypothetical protein
MSAERATGVRSTASPVSRRLSAFYSAGPMFDLGTRQHAGSSNERASKAHERGTKTEAEVDIEHVPVVHGEGQPHQVSVFGKRGTLRLQGRTDADYDGGSFYTQNVVARRATGCKGCSGRACIHVTGTLIATYSVTTRVTLPQVSDYPDLTPRQQQRIRDTIEHVLTPHEQAHVRAFETYNGTTSRRFCLTLCRNAFEDAIRAMFEAEERERRSTAQAASDALDPFHFDVDLSCEEESNLERSAGDGEGQEARR